MKNKVTKYDKILIGKARSVCSHQYGIVRSKHNHTIFIWLKILLKWISFFGSLFVHPVLSSNEQ